jgi:hypothetical protein
MPLPGVSIAVRVNGVLKAATSTDVDGTYSLLLSPSGSYHLTADLPSLPQSSATSL